MIGSFGDGHGQPCNDMMLEASVRWLAFLDLVVLLHKTP